MDSDSSYEVNESIVDLWSMMRPIHLN
jgi:hypothetical protein